VIDPKALTPAQLLAAQAVDLIILPDDVDGTRCGNCRYFVKVGEGLCSHPSVRQPVNNNWCCDEWDAAGAYVFQKEQFTPRQNVVKIKTKGE